MVLIADAVAHDHGLRAGRLATQAAGGDGDAGHRGAPLAGQQIGQPRAVGVPEHEHAGAVDAALLVQPLQHRVEEGQVAIAEVARRGPATRAPCCRRRGPCPSGKTVIADGHCRPIGARDCMYCAFIPNGCSANTTGAAVFGSPSAAARTTKVRRAPATSNVWPPAGTTLPSQAARATSACDSSSAARPATAQRIRLRADWGTRGQGFGCGGLATTGRPAAASPSAGCLRCSRCTRTRGCARPASGAGSPAASTAW